MFCLILYQDLYLLLYIFFVSSKPTYKELSEHKILKVSKKIHLIEQLEDEQQEGKASPLKKRKQMLVQRKQNKKF